MHRITIRYGIELIDRTYDTAPTVSAIKRDSNARASLGYGDNVNVLLNGVVMPDEAVIPNGSTVVVETAANSKA